jgi:hypothetical protein
MIGETVYLVPFKITPRGNYCGVCSGWGEIALAGDYCRVFCEALHFYDGDPECMKKGYRRCAACLAWEAAFLAGKQEAV